ncbi:MAG: hypothetical protein GF403_04175 [Candidatus Coatesbacteria bacterium]|nr:hypothetical protein [Candidatus Coatesbacteria bacterium]
MKRLVPLLLSLLLPALVFAQQKHNRYLEAMELYDAGDYAEAARLLDEHYINHPDCPYTAYNAACCYALIGEADRALLYLDRAIELGVYSFIDDSDFDSIRDGDAFQLRIAEVLGLIEELREKDRPPQVSLPEDPPGDGGYPVVVMLHGYGGSPEPLLCDEIAGTFTERGYLFVAPYADEVRGPRAFVWSGIDGAEARVLETLELLESEYGINESRVLLGGFSQGGAVCLGVGLRNPGVFGGIFPLAGGWNPLWAEYAAEAAEAGLRCYLWIGLEDDAERVESLREAAGVLESAGVELRFVVEPGVAHSLPKDTAGLFEEILTYLVE